jgi:hypothetical protein
VGENSPSHLRIENHVSSLNQSPDPGVGTICAITCPPVYESPTATLDTERGIGPLQLDLEPLSEV